MTDEMIRCPACGLIVWTSTMERHKRSGECLVKTVSDAYKGQGKD